MVGIITIALSSYMIIYSDELYSKLNKFLSIFEFGKKAETNKSKLDLNTDVILFGYNRIGFDLLNSLKKINKSFLIIDYNPDTIKDLESKNIPCIYGDAEDVDLLNDEIKFNEVKMIISTIPDYKTNSMLIKHIRTLSSSTLIFVVSHKVEESIQLYDLGADYVIMPHFLGGVHTGQLIETLQFSAEDYHKYKTEHINYLDLRKMAGHEHPTLEKGEFYQRVF